ncbi:MAG TPA: isochorismatase family protein [Candidatus Limnocylindria bacterium]|jgi:nicotinamidase-related amidase|nr:isochorismatase family protein [Candidatus Limnocylindria bacterium]
MKTASMGRAAALITALLVACTQPAPAGSSPTAPAAGSASAAPAGIPAPVAVAVDPKTTALLVLDITSVICTPRPQCVGTVPKIASLLKAARDAKALVVYSDTPTAGSTILPEVAPQSGEPKVTGRADKFFGTDLEKILKDKGIQTVVVVGSAAHGAVLYTTFGANARGFTAVVADDGISVGPGEELGLTIARWQVLRQPGFTNPDNKPLEKGRVTLSRSDLIGFGTPPTASGGGAATPVPTSVSLPALNAVTLPAGKTAVLALDLINPTCGQRPQCVSSLPKIADLLKRARAANATVAYSLTTAPDAAIRPEVAPASGETIVIGPADKFFNTTLDLFLKSKGVTNLVIVGTAAHGAVLYTSFGANLRGYTVVVPEDGISVGPGEEFGLLGTKWQLLNQPGFANVGNLPLTATRVTLSVTEGITFGP